MFEDAETRAPAPKKDQITGSTKNQPGSASSKTNSIAISAVTETALSNKVARHNETAKLANRPSWAMVTLGMLRSVYRRGAGAFSTSHRPGVTRNQWAMARVNAFMFLARSGAPYNPKYVSDFDLLNTSHPKYSAANRDYSRASYAPADTSLMPTDAMVVEAQKGLDWRAEFKRGGTAVGVARARDIINRKNLPIETWRRIKAYFDRHAVDKEAEGFSSGEAGYPSAGRIAWALWGGDAGYSRATEIVNKSNESRIIDMTELEERDGNPLYPISPRQMMQAEMDHEITDLFGQYDQGPGEGGAHYMSVSAFSDSGMICSNCVQYEGPRACHVVAGDIDPGGLCKRWVIPAALIPGAPTYEGTPSSPEVIPMDNPPVRYQSFPVETRKIGGREVEFRSVTVGPLEVQVGAAADGMAFSGYAAVFNRDSEPLPFIEQISPGAFTRSLGSGREVRMFNNHNTDQVIATTRNDSLTLVEDARGLRVDATLPNTTLGRDLAVLIADGVVHSMSFGFSVPTGGDTWSDNRQSRVLREVILHEVSIVQGFPAYPDTAGAAVRATEEEDAPELSVPVAMLKRKFELHAKRVAD